MKHILLSFYTCLLLVATVQAQQANGQLDVQLNKNILQPGDSLLVTVNYKRDARRDEEQLLATLELLIENEQGRRTNLRWPVIDGQASGAIYLPDSLPQGKYTLLAGLQQRFFAVRGELKNNKSSSIQAMLLTKSGDWAVQEIQVDEEGTFAIRNWLFEDNGLLAFSGTRNNNELLNIRISTQLDSNYAPVAVAGKAFYVGNPPAAVRSTLEEPVISAEAIFTNEGTVLPAVVVRSTAKSRADQFSEEFSSGLFRSINERVISVMDDPASMGFPNIFSYLQGRVAGLQIAPMGFFGGTARWRGSRVTFFLDEFRVPAEQIANIPIADIAIVKAFPPPFLGAPGGGAAIAVYTRRGGATNYLPPNSQVFKVRGYTPAAAVLDMDKSRL